MQLDIEIDGIDPHVDFLGGFTGCLQEANTLVACFGNSRLDRASGIENAIRSVRKRSPSGLRWVNAAMIAVLLGPDTLSSGVTDPGVQTVLRQAEALSANRCPNFSVEAL